MKGKSFSSKSTICLDYLFDPLLKIKNLEVKNFKCSQ